MNLGYVTSFIIASLVLLSLVALNSRIMRGSGEQTLYTMTKIQSDMIVDYVKEDMRTMGYGVDGTAITIAEPTRIQFLSHADPMPNQRVIDWVFDEGTPVAGRNPNVSPLYRRQVLGSPDPIFDPEADPLALIENVGTGVVRFRFEYLNSNRVAILPGDPLPVDTLSYVCQIGLEMIVESPESYDLDRFERSVWSADITPFNLNCTTSPPLP